MLTLTTCKRLDLFKRTIESFRRHCLDLTYVTKIVHYDDSSSKEDRQEMTRVLMETRHGVPIHTRYYDSEDISTTFRHATIMRQWKQDVENKQADYVFHLEDDWEFTEDFSLHSAIEVLRNERVAYAGFSQPKRETSAYEIRYIGNFWEWIYDRDKPLRENLFEDIVIMKEHPHPQFWCMYVNWPYFSFRPGVHDVHKLSQVDNFRLVKQFELEFSIRYSKLFTSYNHKHRKCNHIGTELSAYELLQSSR